MLNNQVEKMSHMLNDLLDYSLLQTDAGKFERVDVGRLISDAADLVLQDDGFGLEIEGDMPVLVADPTPLSLIFRNLIENAVKHHDKNAGVIKVSAAVEGDFARFAVIDDGPGIPEKFRAVIFEFFKSLDPLAGKDGAGMGLTFVKKAVLKQGGEISVANNPDGRGASFAFTWPLVARGARKADGKQKRHNGKAANH
jgi:signal transduction histidine kinase